MGYSLEKIGSLKFTFLVKSAFGKRTFRASLQKSMPVIVKRIGKKMADFWRLLVRNENRYFLHRLCNQIKDMHSLISSVLSAHHGLRGQTGAAPGQPLSAKKKKKCTTLPDLSLMLLYLFFLYSAAAILYVELSSVTRCGI